MGHTGKVQSKLIGSGCGGEGNGTKSTRDGQSFPSGIEVVREDLHLMVSQEEREGQ